MSKKLKEKNIDEIRQIVKESLSKAECLRKLNLKPSGGNYKTFDKVVKENEISIDHFNGQGWNTGERYRRIGPEIRPLKEILIQNSPHTSSSSLRKRLINCGIKKHECEDCKLSTWNGKPIPIELEHINGINNDNRIKNLKILCPNCHAQTQFYRGKNIKSVREKNENDILYNPDRDLSEFKKTEKQIKVTKIKPLQQEKKSFCECGNLKNKRSLTCIECYNGLRSSDKRPPVIQLLEDFKILKSFVQVGNKYDVSDNAVRKWVNLYRIENEVKKIKLES